MLEHPWFELCSLTLELSCAQRHGALAARRKMKHGASRPGRHAVACQLERRVRQHSGPPTKVMLAGAQACHSTATNGRPSAASCPCADASCQWSRRRPERELHAAARAYRSVLRCCVDRVRAPARKQAVARFTTDAIRLLSGGDGCRALPANAAGRERCGGGVVAGCSAFHSAAARHARAAACNSRSGRRRLH